MTNKLKIHTFMHVPFEGLGCIENWIKQNAHLVNYTKFYEDFILPNLTEIDWLIVMGGPMSVYDEATYPWLKQEKEFIHQAISQGKTVIGICLGSQLIAEVLGANVYPNKQKEIGWFEIEISEKAKKLPLTDGFDNRFTVFHWHGDTYDLPAVSTLLYSSDICTNQAFIFNNKVLGLQFHLEVTPQTVELMVENGALELVEGETIQSAKQLMEQSSFIEANNQKMYQLLDYFEKNTPKHNR
jgi:GMP synthase-like glutamine amidotransferase